MGGDEEDDAGIDKYANYTEAKDSRLFHVGTAAGSYVQNRAANLVRTVIVTDATGIKAPEESDRQQEPAYNLSGQRLQKMQNGIVIQNGKKFLIQ